MIQINDITYKEYLELDDREEYDYCIKFAYSFNKSVDILNIGDFTLLEFGIIKDLQFDINQLTWDKLFEYINIITGIDIKEIVGYKLIEICQIKSYILSEISRITEIESIVLSHNPTDEEINAGLDELSMFGGYAQIRQIAVTFNTNVYEVRKWKYEDCFTELVYQKRLYDYQSRYNDIINRKNN